MKSKIFLLLSSFFSFFMAVFAIQHGMKIEAYGWFAVCCVFLTGTFILHELEIT